MKMERIILEPEEIEELYKKALFENDMGSQLRLGEFYLSQSGTIYGAGRKAMKWYARAAEQGCAEAQFQLAEFYVVDRDIQHSMSDIMDLYSKAAVQGHELAKKRLNEYQQIQDEPEEEVSENKDNKEKDRIQKEGYEEYCLGKDLYDAGRLEIAMEHFKAASDKGCLEGKFYFDICRKRKIELRTEDDVYASLLKSAKEGDVDSCLTLGVHYFYGKGFLPNIRVETDYKEAIKWFKLALNIDSSNQKAKFYLAFCYHKGKGVEVDVKKAVSLYEELILQGDNNAKYELGECYYYGIGVEKNPKKAVNLFQDVAYRADDYFNKNIDYEKNNWKAQLMLGKCYYYGKGINCNYKKAFDLFNLAKDNMQKIFPETDVEEFTFSSDFFYDLTEEDFIEYGEEDAPYELEKDRAAEYSSYLRGEEENRRRGEKEFEIYKLGRQKLEIYTFYLETVFMLAKCYFYGNGIETDQNQAEEYIEELVEKEYPKAQTYRGDTFTLQERYEDAIYWYKKAANQGEAVAQYNLGVCLSRGQGIEKSLVKAFEWYRKSAENNYSKAQYNLGYCYYYGIGTAISYEDAFLWYKRAAEQEMMEAEYALGKCYELGKGVNVNNNKAFECIHNVALHNSREAQNVLGYYYQHGIGTEISYEEAFEWYLRAANSDLALAQYNIGYCYYNGIGVEQSYSKAQEWYRKAADKNLTEGLYGLAKCYENRKGVDAYLCKDEKEYESIKLLKAIELYRKAALQCLTDAEYGFKIFAKKRYEECAESASRGDLYALFVKAEIDIEKYRDEEYYCESDILEGYEEAILSYKRIINIKFKECNYTHTERLYKNSAENGFAFSQYYLAKGYLEGKNIEKNYLQATKWYQKAAEQGYACAQFALANCYFYLDEVKNLSEAVKWYKKAAEQGHKDAQYQLGKCYEEGIGISKDQKEAVKWYKKAAENNFTTEYDDTELSPYNRVYNWYKKSAEEGNGNAWCVLGQLCIYGDDNNEENRIKGIDCYYKAIEIGCAEAYYWLGICYRDGTMVEKSETKAKEFYDRAIENGYTAVQYDVYFDNPGYCIYENEVELLESLAEHGNIEAQYRLAEAYDKGYSITRKGEDKKKWYEKIAAEGSREVQYFLAYCNEEGYLGTQSYEEAVKWYKKAAEQGDVDARYSLAFYYKYGIGVTKSNKESERWFKSANVYHNNIDVKKYVWLLNRKKQRPYANINWMRANLKVCNSEKAYYWYRKAAENNHAHACYAVAKYYLQGKYVEHSIANAMEYCKKAIYNGFSKLDAFADVPHYTYRIDGQNNRVSTMYEEEVISNFFKEWHEKATKLEDPEAEFNVALCYAQGDGVEKSEEQAYIWWSKSAERGYIPAIYELGVYYIQKTGDCDSVSKGMKLLEKAAISGSSPAAYCLMREYINQLWNCGFDTPLNCELSNFEGREMYSMKGLIPKYMCILAEQGDAIAEGCLGSLYYKGELVPKSEYKAFLWFNEAAKKGFSFAQYMLGVLYSDGYEYTSIEEEVRKYNDSFYHDVYFTPEEVTFDNNKIKKDYKKAFNFFKQAAEGGNTLAQKRLAKCYADGIGTDKSPSDAKAWMDRATKIYVHTDPFEEDVPF